MSDKGSCHLVVDPYMGFSVVFTDAWGSVAHRTMNQQSLERALMEAAQWMGRPLTLELKELKS